MAITLNGGTGVITGLTAGGLPDNSIQDADIVGLTASKLTGSLPAISGASLTGITTGKVLQVVEGTSASQDSTTSGSYVATSLDVTITPSATSSKILVTVSAPIDALVYSSAHIGGSYTLYRDSTDLLTNGGDTFYSSLSMNLAGYLAIQKLDSPSSTSAIVYKIYMKQTQSGTTMKMCHNNSTGVITAMEIGA